MLDWKAKLKDFEGIWGSGFIGVYLRGCGVQCGL